MAPNYTLALAILCTSLCTVCLSKTINEQCRKQLTKLDPHLDAYIGKLFTVDTTKSDKNENYVYEIGVCVNAQADNEACGVLQSNTSDHDSQHCAGKVDAAQVTRTTDGVWIELTYSGGDPYTHHCNGAPRVSRLIFLCDPLISGLGTFDLLEENRDDNVCFYTFTVAAKAVCGSYLSAGDIIMIIVAVIVLLCAAAMLGGCIYKRFIQGAKGMEQIPLLAWFKEFGNLEADGCDLVCRSRKSIIKEYREPTFGADTDDEDDDKDDNLLPM